MYALSGTGIVELSRTIEAAYSWKEVGLVVRWERVADRETISLDSLGLDLARLAVHVAFIHDNVAHDGLELVLGISVA